MQKKKSYRRFISCDMRPRSLIRGWAWQKNLLPLILLALAWMLTTRESVAQTTWNGSTGVWINPGNWHGGVPNSSSVAIIPGGAVTVQ